MRFVGLGRFGPLRFLRFLLLISVPGFRAKAKRFTEGNEGNEELAPPVLESSQSKSKSFTPPIRTR
jgi:hypothetical protein